MSEVTIIYKELEEAEAKSGEVAKYCVNYGEDLQSKVINKIASVSPSPLPAGNSRLNTVNLYVKNKKGKLNTKNSNYKNFACKCVSLSTNAKNADKRVGVEVNTSRENFLKEHPGLKGDGWNAFIATIVAEVPILGWLVDRVNDRKDFGRDVKNTIRKLYEIKGGKKVVDTILAVAGLAVAVVVAIEAVIGAVGAVVALAVGAVTVGAVAAAIVAVVVAVGAIIAVINSVVDVGMQVKADTCKDPAFANFYGQQDDLSTVLEKKTFRGKYKNWNNGSMKLAKGLDVIEKICTVVAIGEGIGKGIANIGKEAKIGDFFKKTVKGKDKLGNTIEITKMDFSVLKNKQTWKEIGKTLKNNVSKNSWKELVLGSGDSADEAIKVFGSSSYGKSLKKIYDVNSEIKEAAELGEVGIKIVKQGIEGVAYEQLDVGATLDNVIDITGTEGIVGNGNEIYGEIKDATGFKDVISFDKKINNGKTKASVSVDSGSYDDAVGSGN